MERDHQYKGHQEGFYANFNSHAHVERDFKVSSVLKGVTIISTHTLTWSVTTLLLIVLSFNFISTHTLTWSVTNFNY